MDTENFALPQFDESDPAPEALHRSRPRVGRRIVAGATAALVIGAGGFGLGRALAPQASATSGNSSPSATSVLNGQGTYDGGYGGGSYAGGTYGGHSYGVYGQGGGSYGYGDGGQPGLSPQSTEQSSTPATTSELTGLVRVDTTLGYENGEAAGTGMVLTSDGEVITNHHVVEGATSVKVTVMTTGKSYTAKVIGTDATADVAVLQLEGASGLSTVRTDTSPVAVGDKVTAVGDANGTADQLSAATGKVTAVNQNITTEAEATAKGEALTGLIQMSADVISGDSGGATYNSDGTVVGMTTAASSGGSEVDGFAIPIAKVLSVASDLESGVTSSSYSYGGPAFLGVGLSGNGTVIGEVYDKTAAAKAGIGPGDAITKVDSTTVSTAAALSQAIASHSPGDTVSITWTGMGGSSHTATVTLGTGPIA